MKVLFTSFFIITILCLGVQNLYSNDTTFSQDASSSRQEQDITSPSGIRYFIKEKFNTFEYRNTFLPNNFCDFEELLLYGLETGKSRAYAQAVMRLLKNGLTTSQYINSYAFSPMIATLQQTMTPLCTRSETTEDRFSLLKQKIYNHLVTSFTNFLSLFKKEQNKGQSKPFLPFLDRLSQEIVEFFENDQDRPDDISIADLRKTILVFLETSLAKLIWNPDDGIQTWEITKTIAQQMIDLSEANIIDDQEDLNGLLTSLVERYCFFIELMGSQLDPRVFQQIHADITSRSLLFLELEEQEEDLTPKYERLLHTMLRAEATRKAQELGLNV